MLRQTRYVVGAFGVAVAVLSFAICLEVEVATARPSVTEPTEPTLFNRTLKGDRLRPLTAPTNATTPQRAIPAGCELSFSTIRKPQGNELPGRCIS